MKLLLIGGGAREHALAWKLLRDDPSLELLAAPGNPGLATLARCVAIGASDIAALYALAKAEKVGCTVVGPEAPLAAGIVDRFRQAALPIFGPTRAAARIESSKSFAKELMRRASVPTASATSHTDPDSARRAVREAGIPVVIKASGLAAGKGVRVCGSISEADDSIDSMLRDHRLGDAGDEILVERYMSGEELSLFGLTDGHAVLPMLPAQDHKRLLEGDEGPNTGGMGAYAPVSVASPELILRVEREIFGPVLAGMREAGSPFTGLLYAGLMLTAEGPKVVEFNCRFGDPETEALLPLLESNLLEILIAIARGERLSGSPLAWRRRHAVTTVLAAAGYPGESMQGAEVTMPAEGKDEYIFHAGTGRSPAGTLVTTGGRVLAITAVRDSHAGAHRASHDLAASVEFSGKYFRTDVGWRERRRHASA